MSTSGKAKRAKMQQSDVSSGEASSEDSRGRWVKALGELLKPIGVAAVSGAVSVAAFVLTPFSEVVNTWIWGENAGLELISQSAVVQQGKVLSLDVFVESKSRGSISEGALKIQYPDKLLKLGLETKTTDLVRSTPKIAHSARLTDHTLEFIAVEPGKAQIVATLTTKGGNVFSQAIPITVTKPADQQSPTLNHVDGRWNFTGHWSLNMGGISGSMDIKDVSGQIEGGYKTANGVVGQVEGSHDGETFWLTFHRGAAPSQLSVSGRFEWIKETYVQCDGPLILKVPSHEPGGWEDRPQGTFQATAPTT